MIDPRQADSKYMQFPSFTVWLKLVVDEVRWGKSWEMLSKHTSGESELLKRSFEIVKRAAAVDTGAIEGLYDVDRGFTFTVATEALHWQAALEKKGATVKSLFETQLRAYDYVLDFATKKEPIVEAWIRELHKEMCKAQPSYKAITEVGIQDLPLPLGEYKHLPNHVVKRDGEIHSYAPVDITSAEMARFCAELRREDFQRAHPILQASYAHYAFVAIHPFADGNGRVARALASVFTYRANSVPLLILSENKGEYFTALAQADAGECQVFVDFIAERGLDAMKVAYESLRAASHPSLEASLDEIGRLYVTRGGYSHGRVDQMGSMLFDVFRQEVESQISALQKPGIMKVKLSHDAHSTQPSKPSYRSMIKGTKSILIQLASEPPATASAHASFQIELPKDCGKDDDLIIRRIENASEVYEFRVLELVPQPSIALRLRVRVIVEGILRALTDALAQSARNVIRSR